MFDCRGIITYFRTSVTGLAKTTFVSISSRGRDSNSSSSTSTNSTSSGEQRRARDRAVLRNHVRLSSSEEARNTTAFAREVREEDVISNENSDPNSPFVVVVSCYNIGDIRVEKSVELAKAKKEEKKKKTRELNIPQRDMFAPDFVIQPDEDLPGFSPIDSEYDTDDDAFEAEELNRRGTPRYTSSMPPPLCGINPDIPNEYDPVIGIVAVHGVSIPRSKPIDIVPQREPLFPFFGVNLDLQLMLITERMYDVFKERIRNGGKERQLTLMENLAMTVSVGQMCGRLLPVEMMDGVVFYYDPDFVVFLSKSELIHVLTLCEPDQKETHEVAVSFPSMFHRESPEQILERNVNYQKLLDLPKVYLRRTDYMAASVDEMDFTFPFIESVDNELNQRLTIERQLNDENMDHSEMSALIRTISEDLDEAERQQGIDFLHRSTLSIFDARIMVPLVN